MPKLASVRFLHKPLAGDALEFLSEVNVTMEGQFSFSVPVEIADHADDFDPEEDLRVAVSISGVKAVRSSRRGGDGSRKRLIVGKDRAVIRAYIDAVVADYMKVEVFEEQVLAYRYATGLTYWEKPDGSIHPNGVGREGRWRQYMPGCMHNDEFDGLSFGAMALVRKTHKRGAKTAVALELWRADNHFDDSDPRARLNSFSQIEGVGDVDDRWTIIPYTQEAAEFFYNVTLSLCKVDQRLSAFFSKRENVELAISNGGMPQLLG